MDDIFSPFSKYAPGATPSPEKGVQLRGKEIDGEFYIRAADVVGLLEINGVLPKAVGLLKKRTER